MKVLALYFMSGLATSNCACDKSELAAMKDSDFQIFFIYAAVETFNGSFDLKTFFHVLEFENTSHTLPFAVHPRKKILESRGIISCNEEYEQEWSTQIWLTSSSKAMNAIFHGCDISTNLQMRFIVYNNASWTDSDLVRHCEKFKGGSIKFLGQLNHCMEDFKAYSRKCLHVAIDGNISGFIMISAGILLLIAASLALSYEHFKNVSVSN